MSNLFDTFKEAIENATMKWEEYKQRENMYKGKVNEGLDELQQLIERLKACIDRLVALQDDYGEYIQRITQIRINMQTMLDQQITQITNRSGEDCDEKIRELLEKFQGFVTRIGEWEGDAKRFEGLLAALKTEIDRLCSKADEIIAKNGENRSGLDEELKKVEEAMGQERGASKQESNRETKRPEVQEQQPEQVEVDGLPDGWTAYRDPSSGSTYYTHTDGRTQWERPQDVSRQQPRQLRQVSRSTPEGFNREQRRQQKINELRRAGMSKEDKISEMRSWDRDNGFIAESRNPTEYNNLFESGSQRGGWQTPEKLESISRYSPIRRVERKKKKKNTKKHKKNKRKRKRGKQTKRKGRKRN